MRFKAVPPTPPTDAEPVDEIDATETIRTVRDVLPLVPRPEDDCCGRLVDRVDWIEDREVATQWIVFLRALGLVERSDAGYARVRGDIDSGEIAGRFREHVVGVDAAVDALDEPLESPGPASGSRTAEELFEAIQSDVPEWERHRSETWRAEWLERTERILAWAALFGIVERVDDGYRRT